MMIRSLAGMRVPKIFKIVVLPLPVPPLMSTLRARYMHTSMNRAASSVMEPRLIKSTKVGVPLENLRIESVVPLREHGGITAATRLPSGSRASKIGSLSLIRRPTNCAMFLTAACNACSSPKVAGTFSKIPLRSTNTSPGPLTSTSLTVSSCKYSTTGARNASTDRPNNESELPPVFSLIRSYSLDDVNSRTMSVPSLPFTGQ